MSGKGNDERTEYIAPNSLSAARGQNGSYLSNNKQRVYGSATNISSAYGDVGTDTQVHSNSTPGTFGGVSTFIEYDPKKSPPSGALPPPWWKRLFGRRGGARSGGGEQRLTTKRRKRRIRRGRTRGITRRRRLAIAARQSALTRKTSKVC